MKFHYKYLLVSLAFHALALQAHAQDLQVSGTVSAPDGPLPGANVTVKHKNTGTITDLEGKYALTVQPNDTLVFSYVGYKTITQPVEGRTSINVQLKEDATALGEVVINAGYYNTTQRERTGSISRITAKEIENQPVGNALSAVQGRMAGVNIIQNSGVPGGGFEVRIRGTNSLRKAGNYPMYIVDGVPINPDAGSDLSAITFPNSGDINPLNAINPNNIESIEVLKDADATAIYGSRGANGVILITTKNGNYATKTSFAVNSSMGFSQVANKMKMMNTQQYLNMRKQAFANDGVTEYPTTAYDVNGTWDQNRYTDWQEKLIGGTATNTLIQLSLKGGSENTSFLVSGSHNEQTTVFSEDYGYKTNKLFGKVNYRSDDDKFTFTASGMFADEGNNLIQTDITRQALHLSPSAPALYKEDGSLNWEDNTFVNPVAAYEQTYSYKSRTFITNLNLGYEFFPDLKIKLNGGITDQVFNDAQLNPNTAYNPSFGLTPAMSQAYKSWNQRFSFLLEPQVNYKYEIDNHEFNLLAGGTYQQTKSAALKIFGSDFESNAFLTNLMGAGNVSVNSDDETVYKYVAAFGRINYQFKDRYILNLTGRRDGSSRFGPDKRFSNFGAVGAAWIFSEEKGLSSKIPFLSFGKLRASYGITGSDAIGNYQYLDSYSVGRTKYGNATTVYPSRLFNPNFSWEETSKMDVALELGFLKNRLQVNASWYRNRSGNQLVGIPLPRTTGFGSIQANLPATVQNKGLELEIFATPIKTDHFQWNSDFNISFPKNELIAFPNLEASTYANQYVIGHSTNSVKVYKYEGIDPETGRYTFKDYNNDGEITPEEDQQFIEEIGPTYFGGWSNQISYKNFEFSFLFQFVKQKQKNYLSLTPIPGSKFNQPVELLDVWSENNPDGKYMPYTVSPDPESRESLGYFANSSASISDASYIRLKNVQLSYKLYTKSFLKDVLIYVQGQNLLTITNYFGLDPEFSQIGFLPPLQTYAFGAQFNF